MPATIAAPAAVTAAPAAPAAPTTPKNGAATEAGQPPATDPKVNAKPNNEAGAKPGETAAETRQRMKLKLRKLDGEGVDELDLDENEIGRYVQKARVADKNRAADDKARAEWQAKIDAATTDPLTFFKERGVDLMEVAAQEHARQQELAALDPVQRELAETKSKLEKYEAEKTQAAEQAKVQAAEQAQRQLVVAETTLYKQAIAASGRAPKTPAESGYLMSLYADVREMAEHAGVPLTAEQLAQAGDKLELSRFENMTRRCSTDATWRAKNMKALQSLAESITTGMDDAALMSFFGIKTATRLGRAHLSAYRKNPLPTIADPTPSETQSATRPPAQGDNESLMGMMDRIANR